MSNDPDVIRARVFELASSIGLVDERDLDAMSELAAHAAPMIEVMGEDALVGLLQAYGRAVDRIASAEAEIAARHLAEVDDDAFETELERWLGDMLPLASDTFALIHARRLEQLVRRRATADMEAVAATHADTDREVADLAVAMIDLRGSTAFMLDHPPDEIRALVDELYFAVARVATQHDVHAGKFLGDGVLFFSADQGRLLDATLAAVHALGAQTALRAGAGIAGGPVIRRAGDWFGTPVNLASRLGELAGPGEVLVDETALPAGRDVREWRWARPRGLADERRLAVL